MFLLKFGVIAAACLIPALFAGSNVQASQRQSVWERVDQFVAVEKQDSAAQPNDHPAHLLADQVRATLAPLRVSDKGDEPVLLFTEGELNILADGISAALERAAPTEDVTFAVIGLHGAVLGVFKQPMVTTGRLFFRQGALHLILGQVHEAVNDRDDRRLKPFVPGSRSASAPHRWELTARSGQTFSFAEGRTDWLILKPVAAVPAPPTKAQTEEAKPRPLPQQERSAPPKGIEERLRLLKDLREKNLITDEEYQAKRKELLSEI